MLAFLSSFLSKRFKKNSFSFTVSSVCSINSSSGDVVTLARNVTNNFYFLGTLLAFTFTFCLSAHHKTVIKILLVLNLSFFRFKCCSSKILWEHYCEIHQLIGVLRLTRFVFSYDLELYKRS